jgi:hypothetical protein
LGLIGSSDKILEIVSICSRATEWKIEYIDIVMVASSCTLIARLEEDRIVMTSQ